MKHPNEGLLRAYLDGEVEGTETSKLDAHLATCVRCSGMLETLRARSADVAAHFEAIAPQTSATAAADETRAAAVLGRRLLSAEAPKRGRSRGAIAFGRWPWPAWAGLAAAGLAVLIAAFPPLRAVALDFIELFRVERVRVAEINLGDLPGRVENSAELSRVLSEQVHVTATGERREVASTPEASAAAGFDVRLPEALGVPSKLAVEPGARVNLRVDLPRVREVLRELGRSDIELPGDVDGAEVRMVIGSCVRAEYGDSSGATMFLQIPRPEVTAPPDLPMDRIGEAVLQVFGMTADEAVRFSRSVDWSTTLVVPVPRDQADYEEVAVDGVSGTLIHRRAGLPPSYLLVWVRDGIIYALSGAGTPPAISMTSLPRVAERRVTAGVSLSPNPNPSRGTVVIGYAIPAEAGEGPATLDIYDVTGRRLVRYDLPGTTREGTVSWNGTDDRGVTVAPGIYYARLSAGKVVATSRISRAR